MCRQTFFLNEIDYERKEGDEALMLTDIKLWLLKSLHLR